MIYWFIGQPGSGKTTQARKLKNYFDDNQTPAVHLDGDDLRVIFGGQYKTEHFTKEYRDSNTRKLQTFVEYLEKQGINVIVSTVNSDRALREELKTRNPNVKEVYVYNSGPHVREDRKYVDFEEPLEDFTSVDTNGKTPDEAFNELFNKLKTTVVYLQISANNGTRRESRKFKSKQAAEQWIEAHLVEFGGFPLVYTLENKEII